jgi:hypothetical protein
VFEFSTLDVGEGACSENANPSQRSSRTTEADTVNQLGRPCSICNSRFKREINQAIESGISISVLSEKFEFSRSSGYRHAHHHLHPDPGVISLAEYAEVTTNLLDRFAEIADDMRNIRRAAVAAGNTANAVKAADQELKTLLVMSERMGVDDTRVQEVLSQFRAVSFASLRVMEKHEKVGQAIIAQLETDGESDAQMSVKRVLRESAASQRERAAGVKGNV